MIMLIMLLMSYKISKKLSEKRNKIIINELVQIKEMLQKLYQI